MFEAPSTRGSIACRPMNAKGGMVQEQRAFVHYMTPAIQEIFLDFRQRSVAWWDWSENLHHSNDSY